MKLLNLKLAMMVFSVNLQRSAVGTIVNFFVRGQFNASRSLRLVALQWICLSQEAQTKAGRLPKDWDENPHRLQQKDLDARWVKKIGIRHYGYKNSIYVDVDHGFIRRYAVTPANIHDSQMLPRLLDSENEHDYVWADSAYTGKFFQDLPGLAGFESLIHEKRAWNHPLGDDSKQLNRVKSAIRVCVEHVFGCMNMSMGGKLTRKICLGRTEAWWGLKNLTYNFLRYLQRL